MQEPYKYFIHYTGNGMTYTTHILNGQSVYIAVCGRKRDIELDNLVKTRGDERHVCRSCKRWE